jgi:raffinose/stachyose/melibiose transport system substrate-binding protein
VERRTISRRTFLNLAVGTGAGAALAACGKSGPSSSSGNGGGANPATYWFLTGQPDQGIREDTVKRFNQANPKTQIKSTEFQNDAYKTKIKTAIGAGQAPTIIWGWGGGEVFQAVFDGQKNAWSTTSPTGSPRTLPSRAASSRPPSGPRP